MRKRVTRPVIQSQPQVHRYMQSSLPVPSQATITVNIGIVQSQQVFMAYYF